MERPIRVLPHDFEAEKSVIGSMLMDKDAIQIATEILVTDDFYNRQYAVMFDCMAELYRQDKPVDLVTLRSKIEERDTPPETYSVDFIRDIMVSVPTSINVKGYSEIVRDKSILRRIIKANEEIEDLCYIGKEDLSTILSKNEKYAFELSNKQGTSDYTPISKVAMDVLNSIEKASKTGGSITGVPSGFIDLDRKTSGFQKSDLILIAARPSMGKTAFILNVIHHASLKSQVPCMLFSLEMSKNQLVNRMISIESGVDSYKLRTGMLSETDWDRVVGAVNEVGSAKIIIDDTSGISVSELRTKCRKAKTEHDIGLIVIDYLQLMTGSSKTESRQQEISEISRALKGIARELDVPVIALSQLSRACETRSDHRPMLSDLRESGAIEQDADIVMFLYRDDYYNADSDDKNIAEVIISKQRNGAIGTVKLAWNPDLTKFMNLEKEY